MAVTHSNKEKPVGKILILKWCSKRARVSQKGSTAHGNNNLDLVRSGPGTRVCTCAIVFAVVVFVVGVVVFVVDVVVVVVV